MNDNPISIKSKAFGIRTIRLYQYLLKEHHCPREIAAQILRSGTSIGANVREGEQAQSKSDFVSKMNIALKEANETAYWLELLHETNYLPDSHFKSIYSDCEELNKILVSIVKNSKI